MDVNYSNDANNNALTKACMNNKNLDIIKYLIEGCKMDPYQNINSNNCCVKLAIKYNQNVKIIKYLLEFNDVPLLDIEKLIDIKKIKNITRILNNYKRLNEFLSSQLKQVDNLYNKEILSVINPLLLNEQLTQITAIDPYNIKWDQFIKYVDPINCHIPLQFCDLKIISEIQSMNDNNNNYNNNDVLFSHYNKLYHGQEN